MILTTGNLNYSSWSARAWMAVKSCGIHFEHQTVPLFEEGYKSTLLKLSPTGLVPVLQDEGFKIFDSSSIVEYLYEKEYGRGLFPQDPGLRAAARSMVGVMHSGFPRIRSVMPMNIRARKNKMPADVDVLNEISQICTIWEYCFSIRDSEGPGLLGKYSAADIFYAPIALRFNTYSVQLRGKSAEYVESLLNWPLVMNLIHVATQEPWSIQDIDGA